MLAKLLRSLSVVGRLLGRTAEEWAEWASANPEAAALALDAAAEGLEARARARKRKNGWWARRLREQARGFRRQAEALRDAEQRQGACDSPPGQWTG